MSSLKSSYREKANDPNTQMTGPENKHDRGHNAMGRAGVGENWKLKKTGPAPLTECDQTASLGKENKMTWLKKSHRRNDSGVITKNFTIRDIPRH
jgi:hypothetical protein